MDNNEMNLEPENKEIDAQTMPAEPNFQAETEGQVQAEVQTETVEPAQAVTEAQMQEAPQETPHEETQEAPQGQPQSENTEWITTPPVLQPTVEPVAKKKGKGGLIALIVVAAAVGLALIIAIVFAIVGLAESPKSKTTKGFTNLALELSDSKNPVLSQLKLDELQEKRVENGSVDNLIINLSDINVDGINLTVGVDVNSKTDMANKKLNMDMAFSVMNISLFTFEAAADEENFYLSVPKLFSDTVQFPVKNFAEKFNRSVLAEATGLEVPEDYEYEMFTEEESMENLFSDDFIKTLEEDNAAILASMEVSKTTETKEMLLNGKEVKCKGYAITVGADEVNQLYQDMLEEIIHGKYMDKVIQKFVQRYAIYGIGEVEIREELEEIFKQWNFELDDDLEMTVYLDKKNRIVSIETETVTFLYDFGYGEEEMTLDMVIDFLGTKRTTDEIEAQILMNDGYGDLKIVLTRTLEEDKDELGDSWILEFIGDEDYDEYLSLRFDSDWTIEDMAFDFGLQLQSGIEYPNTLMIELKGSIPEYEAGESCTFEIDNATMYIDEDHVITISGEYTMGVLDEEIEMPSDSWDILEASKMELFNFLMEINDNMEKLIPSGLGY